MIRIIVEYRRDCYRIHTHKKTYIYIYVLNVTAIYCSYMSPHTHMSPHMAVEWHMYIARMSHQRDFMVTFSIQNDAKWSGACRKAMKNVYGWSDMFCMCEWLTSLMQWAILAQTLQRPVSQKSKSVEGLMFFSDESNQYFMIWFMYTYICTWQITTQAIPAAHFTLYTLFQVRWPYKKRHHAHICVETVANFSVTWNTLWLTVTMQDMFTRPSNIWHELVSDMSLSSITDSICACVRACVSVCVRY